MIIIYFINIINYSLFPFEALLIAAHTQGYFPTPRQYVWQHGIALNPLHHMIGQCQSSSSSLLRRSNPALQGDILIFMKRSFHQRISYLFGREGKASVRRLWLQYFSLSI